MNNFNYKMPVRVHFGTDSVKEYLSLELEKYGKNIMVAYGGGSIKRNGVYDEVINILNSLDKNIIELTGITANPTYQKVLEGIDLYKKEKIDLILAIGGGSVVDCCKIIAAGADIEEDLWDQQVNNSKVATSMGKYAVILTMSGAGAEMDCLGACTNEHLNLKKTLVGPYADFVIEDPRYLMSAPLSLFMPGVFDSLSHCMETYFGKETNVSDEMNLGLMHNIVINMKELIKGNDTLEIRSNLMWDSSLIQTFLFAIGKAGDFQVHHLENSLGAYSHGTHGKQLAIMQPVYYKKIYKEDIIKFKIFATKVFDIDANNKNDEEIALEGLNALQQLIIDAKLPTSFKEAGYELTVEVATIVANNTAPSSSAIHPMSNKEMIELLMTCK